MKTETVIQAIDNIVKWYGKTKNPSPDQLIENYKKITGYLWFFADIVATAKDEYNQKYYLRKIETVRSKMNLIKKGMAVNKADAESMLEHEDIYMTEIEAESIVYRADLLLRQGNRVADCIRTEISWLKQEKQQNEKTH